MRPGNSLKRMLILVFIFTSLLFTGLIAINFYSSSIIDKQVMDANLMILELYVDKLDNIFSAIENQTVRFLTENQTLRKLAMNGKNKNTAFLGLRLDRELKESFNNHQELDGIFVYQEDTDTFVSCINHPPGSIGQRNRIIYQMKELCTKKEMEDGIGSKVWSVIQIGESFYTIRLMYYKKTYMINYIEVSHLLQYLSENSFDEFKEVFLADKEGRAVTNHAELLSTSWLEASPFLYQSEHQKYVVLKKEFHHANFYLVALSNYRGILMRLNNLQIVILMVATFILCYLVIMGFYIKKTLIYPVKELMGAMKQVENGNLDIRIEKEAYYREFGMLNQSFNHMTSQLSQLKIAIYEEKLNRRATTLQFLQIQTNPHFFLNALNVIYSLTLTQNVALIKQLTLCLMKHFRYILRAREKLVPLKEELDYIENYIEIQQIRFSYSVGYQVEIKEECKQLLVPPMLVQTFVENSMKYAITEEGVQIDVKIWQSEENLNFLIEDNGMGFSEEILEKLKKGVTIIDERGVEHFGISNVNRRLQILYNEKASLSLSNKKERGAKIFIQIPAKGER